MARQVFRLMDLPDKVIAFDELPERLLEGIELHRATGFPRHWKEWLGKTKKVIKLPPERDPLTQQVRTFELIIEEDYFFYLIDWNLGPVVERWAEICDYVRQNVPKDFRIKETIEDMAIPLAANKTDSVTLEPEDVVVIPLPKETPMLVTPAGGPVKKEESQYLKCQEEGCTSEFEGKFARNALRLHMAKKHAQKVSVA